jgi:hypothetical protein
MIAKDYNTNKPMKIYIFKPNPNLSYSDSDIDRLINDQHDNNSITINNIQDINNIQGINTIQGINSIESIDSIESINSSNDYIPNNTIYINNSLIEYTIIKAEIINDTKIILMNYIKEFIFKRIYYNEYRRIVILEGSIKDIKEFFNFEMFEVASKVCKCKLCPNNGSDIKVFNRLSYIPDNTEYRDSNNTSVIIVISNGIQQNQIIRICLKCSCNILNLQQFIK